ncbi:MAG TPA: toxin TcdB middle/N-terminal domain-containing protein, partial [Polyangia bacterium]|nr:toxin TcdB middle/N-terminal domain-containing protein [Polyangia bacterium]
MTDRSLSHARWGTRRTAAPHPGRLLAAALLGAGVLLGLAGPARAGTQVDPFYGAFGTEVDIEVPKFRSLEPTVKLVYSSTGANGLVGVGWTLSTTSVLQRGAPGGGAPRYDASDSFFLDGQELVPCTDLGGTHCTRIQSYQRIQWDGTNWVVTQKSGVRAVYTPLVSTERGVYRWGLSTLTDTHNNTVSFNYWCDTAGSYPNECYLDTIAYGGATIRFYREYRPDPMVYGRGASTFGRMSYRLKTIDVTVGGSRVRSYTLGYRASAASARSLLTSVQQYGRDAAVDAAGAVTSGSALPAMTFTWRDAAPAFGYAQLVLSNLGNSVAAASGGNNDGDNYPTISYPDINGDGKADVCWRGDSGYFCALSRGDGTFQAPVNVLWQLGNSVSNYYGGNNDSNNYPTIRNPDVNGDGKSDVCWRGDSGYFCAFSNGDGTFQAPVNQFTHLADGVSSAYGGNNDDNNYPTIRTPDLNGDGKSDVCWRGDSGYWCALSTGTGYATPTSSLWQLGDGVSNVYGGNNDGDNYPTINNPDINGDRRADVCWRGDTGYWCALALESGGFAAPQLVLSALGNGVSIYSGGDNNGDNYPTIRNPDINGDGLSDVCWRGDYGYWCALALGNGSFATPQLALTALGNNVGTAYGGDNNGDNYPTINNPDVNGDGLADVCWRGDTGYWCGLSRGDGSFTSPTQMLWNLGNNVSVYSGGDNSVDNYPTISNPDINGDGAADLCWRGDTGLWCSLSQAVQMDLVTGVQNGIGGTTNVQYRPSSAWSNTYLPVGTVLQTASSITIADGRGSSSTTNYTYQGALWSSSERRFLGFRRVVAVIDAAGNYTETYYHQHAGCIAKPEVTYYRDAAGNLFSYSSYDYTENAAPPYTSLLTSRWDYECNQSASCRRILTQIGYDTYGNATTTYEYGDYDVGGDERTVLRGYYPNTTSYIAAAPAYENVYSGIGTSTLVAQTLYEYDGNTTYAAAPGIGELRRKKAWNSQTGGYATTSYGYDAWGNVTTETNALGVARTTDYDASYHLYATRKCDALGSCSTQSWDYVLGQMTAITDVNALTTSYTYDALGRPLRKTAPDGGYLEYSYVNWGSPTSQRTRTTLWDGSADGLWKDSYQDG